MNTMEKPQGKVGARPFLDKPMRLSLVLPERLREQLTDYCDRENISLAEGARRAVSAFVATEGQK